MKLFTTVPFPGYNFKAEYLDQLVFFGSCFADHIGGWLQELKFDTGVNQMGITYNPISMSVLIDNAISNRDYVAEDLIYHNEKHVHLDLHSCFNQESKAGFLATANERNGQFGNKLRSATAVFLTFGTAIAYRHKESGKTVNNCHKLPAVFFEKVILEYPELLQTVSATIEKLCNVNPKLKIFITVSPIRHLRHGAVQNQRSKSRLLLLCEALENNFENCHYIPVYELVMDELRDYRYYRQNDLLHLNELGLEIVKMRIKESLISKNAFGLMQRIEKWKQKKNHRSMSSNTKANSDFSASVEAERSELEKLLPGRF